MEVHKSSKFLRLEKVGLWPSEDSAGEGRPCTDLPGSPSSRSGPGSLPGLLCRHSPGRGSGQAGGLCQVRRLQEVCGPLQHLQGGGPPAVGTSIGEGSLPLTFPASPLPGPQRPRGGEGEEHPHPVLRLRGQAGAQGAGLGPPGCRHSPQRLLLLQHQGEAGRVLPGGTAGSSWALLWHPGSLMPVSFILSGSGDKGRDQGTALPSLSLSLCHFGFSQSCGEKGQKRSGAGGGYPDAPWLTVAPLPAEPSEPGGVSGGTSWPASRASGLPPCRGGAERMGGGLQTERGHPLPGGGCPWKPE